MFTIFSCLACNFKCSNTLNHTYYTIFLIIKAKHTLFNDHASLTYRLLVSPLNNKYERGAS